ncbi:hypothetical protein ACFW0F_05930 [Brucella anthropi]|uniref:hypothetical protein n=1 Tax=Brucella anthropi TaxID=529 RepID=UPI00367148E2
MKKTFDFPGFASREASEKGTEVPIRNDTGDVSGIVIRIAGPDSLRRRQVAERIFDARVDAGTVKAMTLSEIDAANLEEAVAATISWLFPSDFEAPDCTAENVRKVYTEYPSILSQVIAAGKNKALFTKS